VQLTREFTRAFLDLKIRRRFSSFIRDAWSAAIAVAGHRNGPSVGGQTEAVIHRMRWGRWHPVSYQIAPAAFVPGTRRFGRHWLTGRRFFTGASACATPPHVSLNSLAGSRSSACQLQGEPSGRRSLPVTSARAAAGPFTHLHQPAAVALRDTMTLCGNPPTMPVMPIKSRLFRG
jgi:hypothetical protein